MNFRRFLRDKRKAFTLAEVVIVMGILGVMMVAFAPVISKRTTSSAAAFKNFRPMGTHNGVYFGSPNDDKTVVIGGNYMDASYALNPKLLLVNQLKNSSGTLDLPTEIIVGSGSGITINTGGPSTGLLDQVFGVRLQPQIAFATEVDGERVSQGQLLVTGAGEQGSVILGGRTDTPYRFLKLNNATVLGVSACPENSDFLSNSNGVMSDIVCIGANAGVSTKSIPEDAGSSVGISDNEARTRATSEALAYANANWGEADSVWHWLSCSGLTSYTTISYSSRAEAAAFEGNKWNWQLNQDWNPFNGNWDIFPQNYQKAWGTKYCWLPMYDKKFKSLASLYASDINFKYGKDALGGDEDQGHRIFIGNKDKKYTANDIYFGANSLDDIIASKLYDPKFVAEFLRPHLWATFSLAVKAACDDDDSEVPQYFYYNIESDAAHTDPELVRYYYKHAYTDPDNASVVAKPHYGMVRSDRRLKNVGELFKGGLEQISKLQIFNYTYKNDEKKTPHIGVMAQDLQEVFPDAVKENEEGFLYIRTEDMFYAGLNAIKELYEKVLDHETRIQQLEAENAELRQMYMELAKRVDKLDGGASAKAAKRMEKARKKAVKRGYKTQEEINKTVEELTAPVVK